MPIRFRCGYCQQLLAIATRKAGTETTCPECSLPITVPTPEEAEAEERRRAEKRSHRKLTHASSSPPPHSGKTTTLARQEPTASASRASPRQPTGTKPGFKPTTGTPANSDDWPLFEREIDELLGPANRLPQIERTPPAPTTGVDSLSLDDSPRQIVLTGATATLLTVGVVVLMVVSFVAGYYAGK
jgi:phage FluMu protein Com